MVSMYCVFKHNGLPAWRVVLCYLFVVVVDVVCVVVNCSLVVCDALLLFMF